MRSLTSSPLDDLHGINGMALNSMGGLAASLPARLELAPQFLSSTFGPRSSYSGAPEAATKRQASPAPAASPAKKSSGARAWSPYHAYCKA